MVVQQFYLQSGYDMTAECKGPQDHLGVELRFMAFLCNEEADASERKAWRIVDELRQRQSAFLQQHIARWCHDYCHQLSKSAHE